MSQVIETKIREMLGRIDEIYSLASEDLLESARFYKTKYGIEDELKNLSPNLDERSQLMIKKAIPQWRSEPKPGFINGSNAVREIDPLRELLLHLLVKCTKGSSVPLPKTETLIPPGKEYEGKQYLRSILNQAKSSIFIRDNYLKAEILDILSEYILDKPELKTKLLVGENNRLVAFRTHYTSFNSQYPARVEARYLAKTLQDHPRYIFVDETILFNPDHSLDQWGISTVNVHRIEGVEQIDKIRTTLELEWNSATLV